MTQNLTPFHLAIEVRNLEEARMFYLDILKCEEGRSADSWVDFNFYGHQLVCHVTDSYPNSKNEDVTSEVDGKHVPVPHFGVVLKMPVWKRLAKRLEDEAIEFIIEPHIRFEGEAGEQATMFLLDPSGNALEFKAFENIEDMLFDS